MQREKQPNFLIIISDQHSPYVSGCYGDGVVRTPNLNALASRGIRFTSVYCGSPLCVPSRMSLMTGRLPSRAGAYTNECALSSDVPTFAHALGAAGYGVTLAGRMHFRGPDQLHGFQRRVGSEISPTWYGAPGPEMGMLAGASGQSRIAAENSGPGRTNYQEYDRQVTRVAVEFLNQRAEQGDIVQGDTVQEDDAAKPYCLVVGFNLPHCPFVCPRDLYDEYYSRVPPPSVERPEDPSAIHPAIRRWMEHRDIWRPLDQETIRRARAAYYGLITLMDDNIGEVLTALDRQPDRDNTIVIYLSDHGEMAGEHGLWWKSNFYEASVRVPMIVAAPGRFAARRVVSEPVSLLDLAPTLAELGGGPELLGTDGRSLVGLLHGEQSSDASAVRDILSEFYPAVEPDPPHDWVEAPSRMIRRGPWKLILYANLGAQLFNLDLDPEERINYADDPTLRDLVTDLTQRVATSWQLDQIRALLSQRAANRRVLTAWYKATQPPNPYHSPLPARLNELEYEWPPH